MTTATTGRTRPETRGDHGWREYANCVGMSTEIFYPPGRGTQLRKGEKAALAVCADCPVKAECLDAHRRERYGIFGGTRPSERGHKESR